MPTGSVSKNQVTIWQFLATKKLLIPRAQEYVLRSIYLHIIGNATRISTKVQFCLSIRQKGSQNKPSYDICCELWPFQLLLIKKDTNGEREVQNEDDHSPKFSTWWYFWVLLSKDYSNRIMILIVYAIILTIATSWLRAGIKACEQKRDLGMRRPAQ